MATGIFLTLLFAYYAMSYRTIGILVENLGMFPRFPMILILAMLFLIFTHILASGYFLGGL